MKVTLLFLTILSLALSHVFARECGKQLVRFLPNEFIIGGEDAKEGEFPWYVSYADCGGALIRDNWVLTAGHCLYGMPDLDKTNDTQYKTAYVGIFNNKDNMKHQVKVVKVSEFFTTQIGVFNFVDSPPRNRFPLCETIFQCMYVYHTFINNNNSNFVVSLS